VNTRLKKGDMVMVIAGGHKKKRPIKGKIGRIIRFVGECHERVVVEGINLVTRHERSRGPDKPGGKVQKEAPIHVSNVRYYAEKFQKPVKLRAQVSADGKKVRGYLNPTSKKNEFIQID